MSKAGEEFRADAVDYTGYYPVCSFGGYGYAGLDGNIAVPLKYKTLALATKALCLRLAKHGPGRL